MNTWEHDIFVVDQYLFNDECLQLNGKTPLRHKYVEIG